jgi:uncharacterized protein YjbI with pentapeptide repeats
MANQEQLSLLKEQGVEVWNEWRRQAAEIQIDLREVHLSGADLRAADLREADLSGARLSEANLSRANFRGANLSEADLREADLRRADLSGARLSWVIFAGLPFLGGATLIGARRPETRLDRANLRGADLSWADLSEANLSGAHLRGADLREADLSGANLSDADLGGANLNGAVLRDANLTGCHIFGVSAWRLTLSEGTKQQNLVITPDNEPQITTDDIEVAQFIYLLLHNEKIQRVIDTITSKVVLILGRFSLPERKKVLDALRDELRKPGRNYVPVVFDFEKPRSQNTVNTIMLLARIARFVIADISDAKSVLQELQAIVPHSPKLPVQPIIIAGQAEPGMFDSFEAYPWVLKIYPYDAPAQLLVHLDERVIGPAEAKVRELQRPQPPAPEAA